VSGGDQALRFLYLLGCLVLVASGLAVRRLPLRQTLKMALAWLLIFGAVFLAFTLKDDFAALGRRAYAELRGDNVVSSTAREIRIRASEDGHFYVNGRINGHELRFLVDSGATVTTLSRAAAREAGVQPEGSFGTIVNTANGSTLFDRGTADRLEIGPITRSAFAVMIARNDGELNVVGMNFLSTLSAWGVEGQILVLKS
jgi:aspartyl protease family protein